MKLFSKNLHSRETNVEISDIREISTSEVSLVSGGDINVCPAGEHIASYVCVSGNNGAGATCKVTCAKD